MTLSNASRLAIILILLLPLASAEPVIDVNYPYVADAQEPIVILVNITSEQQVNEVLLSYENPSTGSYFTEYNNTPVSGTWGFEIPAQEYEGTLNVCIQADITGLSNSYPVDDFTIILEGPEPEEPFPWNIVLLVAFLGIALVATELIFKPGLYRPTGRQRAAALEEVDRLAEEAEESSGSGESEEIN